MKKKKTKKQKTENETPKVVGEVLLAIDYDYLEYRFYERNKGGYSLDQTTKVKDVIKHLKRELDTYSYVLKYGKKILKTLEDSCKTQKKN